MRIYKRFKKSHLVLLIMGSLTYCTTPLLIPNEQDLQRAQVQWKDMNMEILDAGHKLYKKKCAHCHYLYRPNSLPAKTWKEKLPEMKKEAQLSDAEYEVIRRYLLTMCDAKAEK